MTVRIRFFALAKDLAGTNAAQLELPAAASVADLRQRVAERWPALALLSTRVMVAVNSEYATDAAAIPDGSEVALIPPVSGG